MDQSNHKPNVVAGWRVARRLWWSLQQPRILGILNVTPDSFSDGGRHLDPAVAAEAAARMLAEGADGIDVGGESTRPGATRVSATDQMARVLPVIEAIRELVGDGPVITVDTTRATVAEASLDVGADAINDVSGGTEDEDMLALAARRGCGMIVMHRLTTPQQDVFSTQYGTAGRPPAPTYGGDVVGAVRGALVEMTQRALDTGLAPEAIMIDPGLGFGKTVEQNWALIERTAELASLGYPVLSGLSRKSFVVKVAAMLGAAVEPTDPIAASTIAVSLEHVRRGARVLRVHDVKGHRLALEAAFGPAGGGAIHDRTGLGNV